MRVLLNWFSPLPPERSGISEFTAALAPLIRERTQARFISERRDFAGPGAFPGAESLGDLCPADINRADVNVYNIGNNASFHGGIWRVSSQNPGIVILHDFRLQHLFGGVFLAERRDREGYLSLMRATYGSEGEAAASLMATGRASPEAVSELFPLVEVALRGAAGVVVHSDEALQAVRARTGLPVAKLNLPYTAGAAGRDAHPRSDRARKELNLVVFGYIGPNRRIEAVLRALAGIELPMPVNLHLIGELWNERVLRERAKELGLAHVLRVHGHLPEESLDLRLSQADLVVNLRWPTMGEASYSQLRAWSHGVPTMVTATGWYAELPRDAVIHISPDREVEEIAEVIRRLGDDPSRFGDIGGRGRQLLAEQYTPESYVDGLLAFAGKLAGSTQAVQRKLASRVCHELLVHGDASTDLTLDCAARALHGFLA
ncbi:MAG: glycosyltransferase [Casimicrobiaceae bacterium]